MRQPCSVFTFAYAREWLITTFSERPVSAAVSRACGSWLRGNSWVMRDSRFTSPCSIRRMTSRTSSAYMPRTDDALLGVVRWAIDLPRLFTATPRSGCRSSHVHEVSRRWRPPASMIPIRGYTLQAMAREHMAMRPRILHPRGMASPTRAFTAESEVAQSLLQPKMCFSAAQRHADGASPKTHRLSPSRMARGLPGTHGERSSCGTGWEMLPLTCTLAVQHAVGISMYSEKPPMVLPGCIAPASSGRGHNVPHGDVCTSLPT